MARRSPNSRDGARLGDFFPEEFIELLTATGQNFIERIGPDLVRQATLRILLGDNVRSQTEPLTRQRIAEVGGALLAMFAKARSADAQFYDRLSALATEQLRSRHPPAWPAQWALGLTTKGVQNSLRGDGNALETYVSTFEEAISQAAQNLHSRLGPLELRIALGTPQPEGSATLGWQQALRLTTALGCAELAIRGSDKSRYGKLFERLVLGSVLSILGFTLSELHGRETCAREFWLSDASDERECDATAIIEPGQVARFDIGFIGIGNPEIVRDKLSRFAREIERGGLTSASSTFVIVDRYPTGTRANSRQLAEKSGTAILQMSMSLWPRDLARELHHRMGYTHPLSSYEDAEARAYITNAIEQVDVVRFVRGTQPESSSPLEGDEEA
jgi:hypothetical protein